MSVSSRPSKKTLPSVGSSSRLIVRNSVDLPEPDGPMITTTSLGTIDRSIPLRTWWSPNHLWIPSSLTSEPSSFM